jgi:hypothetical protein
VPNLRLTEASPEDWQLTASSERRAGARRYKQRVGADPRLRPGRRRIQEQDAGFAVDEADGNERLVNAAAITS